MPICVIARRSRLLFALSMLVWCSLVWAVDVETEMIVIDARKEQVEPRKMEDDFGKESLPMFVSTLRNVAVTTGTRFDQPIFVERFNVRMERYFAPKPGSIEDEMPSKFGLSDGSPLAWATVGIALPLVEWFRAPKRITMSAALRHGSEISECEVALWLDEKAIERSRAAAFQAIAEECMMKLDEIAAKKLRFARAAAADRAFGIPTTTGAECMNADETVSGDRLLEAGQSLWKHQAYEPAMACFLKAQAAAKAGQIYNDACFNIGVMYELGQGVAVDRSTAAVWYERAGMKYEPPK